MSDITIGAPRQYVDHGWPAVSAPITVNGQRFDVYFRSERGPLTTDAGPFVLATIHAALRLGYGVHVDVPVSTSLRSLAECIQEANLFDFPENHHVPLEATPVASTAEQSRPAAPRGVALFFSGGVDSFYSLLKHHDEITHLIYVHGFDTLLSNPTARVLNARALRRAAAEAGKQFFELETNLRSMSDRYERWGAHVSSAAQLAITLVLAHQFETVYSADNFSYSGERPFPAVMSADGVAAVFDGIDAMRLDKVTYIASSPLAMRWLRVCWQNLGSTYNCGRCEKCLRTMIGLELAGALGRCRTFKQPIAVERVRSTDLSVFARFWPELMIELEQRGDHPELAQAIRDSVRASTTNPIIWTDMLAHFEKLGGRPDIVAMVRQCLAHSQAPAEQRERAMRLRKAMAHNLQLEQELAVIKASRSWKLTAPLRAIGERYRKLRM